VRALIPDVRGAPSTRLFQRFVRRCNFDATMAGTLSGRASYLNLNAILMSHDEVGQLADATTVLANVFRKAGACVARDPELLTAYGFPWAFAELVRQDDDLPTLYGRFDFILDLAGDWKVVEYNSDTPSGVRETAVVDDILFRFLSSRFPGARVNHLFAPALARAFAKALPRRRGGVSLGFVVDTDHMEDRGAVACQVRLLQSQWREEQIRTVFGDIDNLTQLPNGSLAVCGQPVDALYRCFAFEALYNQPQFFWMMDSLDRGKVVLLNRPRGLLLQNKGLMAWIWEHRADDVFTHAEQAIIARHVPPTWWVADYPASGHGGRVLVKQVFGREGEEVYYGDAMSETDWANCRTWATFVVQELVETPPLPMVSWDWQGRPTSGLRWPSVGSFVVDDEWAGCYVRVGDQVLTSQSEFVPVYATQA
jgi:glutathionylspermidine synthase